MDWTFVVLQDGLQVARVDGPDRESALREALHYAMQYEQDGPVTVCLKQGRRLIQAYPAYPNDPT